MHRESIGPSPKRLGSVVRLRPEHRAEYLALHAAVWPEVEATIRACNIRNYTIFLKEPENMLFAYWEYHGTDFDADMKKMADVPRMRDWWKITDPCQEPYETRAPGEWWAPMTEIFFHP